MLHLFKAFAKIFFGSLKFVIESYIDFRASVFGYPMTFVDIRQFDVFLTHWTIKTKLHPEIFKKMSLMAAHGRLILRFVDSLASLQKDLCCVSILQF